MSTIQFDIDRISGVITTTGGAAGEMLLPGGMAREILQIVCVPAIVNNMYTFQLVNKNDSDMDMFKRDVDGVLNELISFPIHGDYKVIISGQSSDDTFKIRLIYR